MNKTGTATGTASVSGSGNTRTVSITSISGTGTLGISIAAGSASDAAGNLALAAGPSATFTNLEATGIGSGDGHTCAVVNGGVQCWGSGTTGKLGHNSTSTSFTPVKVQGLPSGVAATKIAASGNFNCALLENQTVSCWGAVDYGQIGNNTSNSTGVLTAVTVADTAGTGTLSGVGTVSTGAFHACALMNNGTVYCWGRNSYGAIGDNTATNRKLPTQVKDTAGTGTLSGATQLSSGYYGACAVMTDGKVMCWGRNVVGQMGINSITDTKLPNYVKDSSGVNDLTGVAEVRGYQSSYCALLSNGKVNCWGGNTSYQIGDGTNTDRLLPVVVKDPTGSADLTGVSSLHGSSYDEIACAVLSGTGEARCWGNNRVGGLGGNHFTNVAYPVAVANESGTANLTGITQISNTGYATCFLLSDKQVRCLGFPGTGGNAQLGINVVAINQSPVTLKDPNGTSDWTGVDSISTYSYSACGVANGAAYCWGASAIGNNSVGSSQFPSPVSGLTSGVSKIQTGNGFACTYKTDGAVWCWSGAGGGSAGNLGQNSTSDSYVPVQVMSSDGTSTLSGVSDLDSGYAHVCASVSGEVYCWGDNASRQLGRNTTTDAKLPIKVKDTAGTGTLSGVTELAVGANHACARISDAVYCWGENGSGQVGINSTTDRKVPIVVPGLESGVTRVTSGYAHSCAKKSDDTVWCWGANASGQLGDGTTTNGLLPVQVQGLAGTPSNIYAPAPYVTCALIGTGLQCWGTHSSGEMGTGRDTSAGPSLSPMWIEGMTSGVSTVFDSGYAPCVKMSSGLTKCWGSNAFMKLHKPAHFLLPTLISNWAE